MKGNLKIPSKPPKQIPLIGPFDNDPFPMYNENIYITICVYIYGSPN